MFRRPKEHVEAYRDTRGLTIYFKDKETVYATDGETTLCFHRWWDLTHYDEWRDFVYKAKYRYLNSLRELEQLAGDYDTVTAMWVPKMPPVPKDTIKKLPDRRNYDNK